jgi:Kef-type K+ transport system membrane component KefB
MSNAQLGSLALSLLLLVLCAHVLGQLCARLRQPKVVGEILAGVLLGPSLLGQFAPAASASLFGAAAEDPTRVVLGFLYHLGLLLLMFVSGASVRHVLGKENRGPTAWLLGLGTPLPFFLALGVAPLLPLEAFMGPTRSQSAVVLVFAVAAAVTSIPVITKIFYDLGILHTRFASLMLGAAVLEDIALWGVLSVATAIGAATLAAVEGQLAETIAVHVTANLAFVAAALLVAPVVLRRLAQASWNRLASETPLAWIVLVLLAYVAVAVAFDVTVVFAAFLAGFGVVGGLQGSERARFRAPLDAIGQIASAVFIPVYFAVVGSRLDFTRSFSPEMLVGFLVGSSLVVLFSIGLAARLAGFRGLDLLNLAITCNARGGPGIVLASVAYDAGLISAPFFTTLVVTAVLTSQACGFWLDFVLRKGWPLLSGDDLRRRGIAPEAHVAGDPQARASG